MTDQIETLVEIESNILCRHRSSLRSRLFEKDPKILGSLINNKSNATTDVVKNHDTNSDFENCEQRNIFIHDYYKKLYDGSFKNPSKIDNFFNNGTSTSIPSPNYPTQNDNLSLNFPLHWKNLGMLYPEQETKILWFEVCCSSYLYILKWMAELFRASQSANINENFLVKSRRKTREGERKRILFSLTFFLYHSLNFWFLVTDFRSLFLGYL